MAGAPPTVSARAFWPPAMYEAAPRREPHGGDDRQSDIGTCPFTLRAGI